MTLTPKKRLGQHFLKDKNIAKKIVNSINIKPELVIEIGPGMGILTLFLKEKYLNFKTIEIDDEAINYLIADEILSKNQIIKGDFLKINLKNELLKNTVIIGNFPYNISSQIFFKILEHKDEITQIVCMLQREVAKRLASPPGNKDYGILSVILQAYYNIEYLFVVPPHLFSPPPKVTSAVIRLTRNHKKNLGCDEHKFIEIIKVSFNQRRKTLKNSLKTFYDVKILNLPIFLKRPEQLNVDDFVNLVKLMKDDKIGSF